MNSSRDIPPAIAAEGADPGEGNSGMPHNWREALMALIAARASLIRLEARQSARNRAGMAVRVIVAAFCVLFAWMLVLAGGVAAIASMGGWPWHWVALATAALHLLLALILFKTVKDAPPAFPATLAEFQKDREWIENFQKKPKSSN